jgi:hypothetical protein
VQLWQGVCGRAEGTAGRARTAVHKPAHTSLRRPPCQARALTRLLLTGADVAAVAAVHVVAHHVGALVVALVLVGGAHAAAVDADVACGSQGRRGEGS